jgi:hypothetical protein
MLSDPESTAVTFVVVDFDGLKPEDHPAEPVEVAAVSWHCSSNRVTGALAVAVHLRASGSSLWKLALSPRRGAQSA